MADSLQSLVNRAENFVAEHVDLPEDEFGAMAANYLASHQDIDPDSFMNLVIKLYRYRAVSGPLVEEGQ